jgi:hypothetical protein
MPAPSPIYPYVTTNINTFLGKIEILKRILIYTMQINIDQSAKYILEKEKDRLRKAGITGASLSDAIRALGARPAKDDQPRRPRGNAGGA